MSDINSVYQKISFSNLLGVPLAACVEAQQQAAESCYDYVKRVGFQHDDVHGENSAVMVKFYFEFQGQWRELSVPLLTLVPLPYMSIGSVDLRFSAEVNASEEGEIVGKYADGGYSESKEQSQQSEYSSRFNVRIQARNDAVPSGFQRVLAYLSEHITSEPVGSSEQTN